MCEITKGMVVISLAGHDSGQWFAVTEADGRNVFLADGKERKLCSPKKKNIRHVMHTAHKAELDGMTDKQLRRTLRALSAQSIAEESEKLV